MCDDTNAVQKGRTAAMCGDSAAVAYTIAGTRSGIIAAVATDVNAAAAAGDLESVATAIVAGMRDRGTAEASSTSASATGCTSKYHGGRISIWASQ